MESIKEIVNKVRNKEITVTELVSRHLEKAHNAQKELNAFISILDEYALEKAREMDEKISSGENLDSFPLLGVPFTAKDLYLVEGVKTTFGTKLMEDFIAPYTGTVIQRCIDSGAVLIGKTNCDPFGFGGSGENSGYGPTKHPLDKTRSPGGSSSGSAASLAAGVGYFSLGTDTGGSVRQPAAMTGVIGYKPTYGRNSRYGISAMGSSFDTPAFFTNSIQDLILLETIMEGKDENDATTEDLHRKKTKGIKTLGVPKEFFGEALNPEIEKAIKIKIQSIEGMGYLVKEVSIPTLEYALAVYYILVPAEISSNRAKFDGVRYGKKVSDTYSQNISKTRGNYFEDEVKRRILIGTYVLSEGYSDEYYKKASAVRTLMKNQLHDVFSQVDALLGPVAPTTAFKLGEKTDDPLEMYLADIYTVFANITGIPALSLPIGTDENNLPIGLQVMSTWWNDENLFTLAKDIM